MSSKVKIFGNHSAFTFETGINESRHIINIDASVVRAGDGWDWSNKLRFQLMEEEIPYFLAVLHGWIPAYNFSFHGAGNDKSLSLQGHDNRIHCNLRCTSGMANCAIMPEPAFRLASLGLRQLQKQEKGMETQTLLSLLKMTIARLNMNQQRT